MATPYRGRAEGHLAKATKAAGDKAQQDALAAIFSNIWEGYKYARTQKSVEEANRLLDERERIKIAHDKLLGDAQIKYYGSLSEQQTADAKLKLQQLEAAKVELRRKEEEYRVSDRLSQYVMPRVDPEQSNLAAVMSQFFAENPDAKMPPDMLGSMLQGQFSLYDMQAKLDRSQVEIEKLRADISRLGSGPDLAGKAREKEASMVLFQDVYATQGVEPYPDSTGVEWTAPISRGTPGQLEFDMGISPTHPANSNIYMNARLDPNSAGAARANIENFMNRISDPGSAEYKIFDTRGGTSPLADPVTRTIAYDAAKVNYEGEKITRVLTPGDDSSTGFIAPSPSFSFDYTTQVLTGDPSGPNPYFKYISDTGRLPALRKLAASVVTGVSSASTGAMLETSRQLDDWQKSTDDETKIRFGVPKEYVGSIPGDAISRVPAYGLLYQRAYGTLAEKSNFNSTDEVFPPDILANMLDSAQGMTGGTGILNKQQALTLSDMLRSSMTNGQLPEMQSLDEINKTLIAFGLGRFEIELLYIQHIVPQMSYMAEQADPQFREQWKKDLKTSIRNNTLWHGMQAPGSPPRDRSWRKILGHDRWTR